MFILQPTTTEPMTDHAPRYLLRRSALAAVMCLTLMACGSGASVVEASRTVDPPPAEAGPQYGDSLDEWTEAAAAQAPTETATSAPSTDPDLAAAADSAASDRQVDDSAPPGYETVEWDDLVEPGFSGEDIYARFEERLAGVVDGSPEANALYQEMQAEYASGARVNPALDGAKIQLAGFVAPLSYDDDVVSEFLLVPYFGACIHVPPPPPNQTILVTLDQGMDIDDVWGPVWVVGDLSVETNDTELANASYTLTSATSRVYEY